MTDVNEPVVRGKVKWFNDQKGFGFIARENEADVFVHHSVINMEGFRTLREGEEVTYELIVSEKGASAVNVNRVSAERTAFFLPLRNGRGMLCAAFYVRGEVASRAGFSDWEGELQVRTFFHMTEQEGAFSLFPPWITFHPCKYKRG